METTSAGNSSTPQPTPAAGECTPTCTLQLITLTVPDAETTFFRDGVFRSQPIATDNGTRRIRYAKPEPPSRTVIFVIDSSSRFVHSAFLLISES